MAHGLVVISRLRTRTDGPDSETARISSVSSQPDSTQAKIWCALCGLLVMAVDLSVPADVNMMRRKSRFKFVNTAAASQPRSFKFPGERDGCRGWTSRHACPA